jgi:hypothetical protein
MPGYASIKQLNDIKHDSEEGDVSRIAVWWTRWRRRPSVSVLRTSAEEQAFPDTRPVPPPPGSGPCLPPTTLLQCARVDGAQARLGTVTHSYVGRADSGAHCRQPRDQPLALRRRTLPCPPRPVKTVVTSTGSDADQPAVPPPDVPERRAEWED